MERKQVELRPFEWAFNLRFDSYNFIHTAVFAEVEKRRKNTRNVSFEFFTAIMCVLFLKGNGTIIPSGMSPFLCHARSSQVFAETFLRDETSVFIELLIPRKKARSGRRPTYASLWIHLSAHAGTLIRILRRLLLRRNQAPLLVLHTDSYFSS